MSIQNIKSVLTMHTSDTYNSSSRTIEVPFRSSEGQLSMALDTFKNFTNQDSGNLRVTSCESECQSQNPLYASRPNIREKYIYKLLGSQQQQRKSSHSHQNIFIFDWDDTVLCTTYLNGKQFVDIDQDCKLKLKQLDQIVERNLRFAADRGAVFIITNSIKGWVDYSGKMYMPKTHQFRTNEDRIKTISARSMFQQKFPRDVKRWKVEAFKLIKNYLQTDVLSNIICIGDGDEEMQACQVLAKDFKKKFVKKIKMQEKPDPQELLKQLKLLDKRFDDIFKVVTNTTIKLAKKILDNNQRVRNHTTSIIFSGVNV